MSSPQTIVENLQRTGYASLAAMALLAFDHAITIDAEVELIWFKPWNWSKVLFFWNRYGTFVILLFDTIVAVGGGPSDVFCLRWQKFQGWTGWLTNMTVEIIIQVRIAAMFSQDRRVVYPMMVLFLMQAIGMATVIGQGFVKMRAVHEPVPGFHACALRGVPPRMYIYWAVNLSFESILFSLALFKAWQNLVRKRGTRPSLSGPRILNILIRDSILYFAVIFVTYIMNLIAWSIGGRILYQLAIALAISLRTSMGSRLLLNVREAYYNSHVIVSEPPLSSIQWKQRRSDCIMMDSLQDSNTSRGTSSAPAFDLERAQSPDPAPTKDNPAQTRSRTVAFDADLRTP